LTTLFPDRALGASSTSSLIGSSDRSTMFPAAASPCASSRHPETRRSRCAADSANSIGAERGCVSRSTLGGQRDRHDADVNSSFDVDQPVALHNHLCAYLPTLRFQQFRRADVPASAIREGSNAASIYRAQSGILRCHVCRVVGRRGSCSRRAGSYATFRARTQSRFGTRVQAFTKLVATLYPLNRSQTLRLRSHL
jgi:hypothetical protein